MPDISWKLTENVLSYFRHTSFVQIKCFVLIMVAQSVGASVPGLFCHGFEPWPLLETFISTVYRVLYKSTFLFCLLVL